MLTIETTYLAEKRHNGFFNVPDDKENEKKILSEQKNEPGIADKIINKMLNELKQKKKKELNERD
ncbi:hypothetical protein [Paenibacillus harenae]|uniref:Uncharacterized protein n=1 Tax=Paenibacillus harenae TaxID=306543 RepID=A0ABT9U7Z7_PAEHA|nr:hypothetical protein [Paenibacillus harenae]MDQ0114339.1 hypothetical protein [Paenibacillus harenae]